MIRSLHRMVVLVAVMLAAFVLPGIAASAPTFPKLTGLVVDDANVLPPDVEARLTEKLQSLRKDTNRHFVVATIGDAQGYPLEEYGNQLIRTWGVGLKDVNNGAILFIAPNNPAGQRGPRIEVGYGLEPVLTDALSSVIINQDMMPLLREQKVPEAVEAGADAVIAQLRAAPDEAKARTDAAVAAYNRKHPSGSSGSNGIPVGLIFWGFILVFFVVVPMFARGSRGRHYRSSGLGNVVLWSIANEIGREASRGSWGGGSSWGGDSGGGGGGGWGGGFGGGGGSGGGGGASGSW